MSERTLAERTPSDCSRAIRASSLIDALTRANDIAAPALRLAGVLEAIAEHAVAMDRLDEGEAAARAAVWTLQSVLAPTDARLDAPLLTLVTLFERAGKFANARALLRRLVAARKTRPERDDDTAAHAHLESRLAALAEERAPVPNR